MKLQKALIRCMNPAWKTLTPSLRIVATAPPPFLIDQLATFLWNIFNDRDASMAILERFRGYWWPHTRFRFFGGGFGSSCQSLGGIYTNTVFWSHFRFRERIMAFTACESEQKPCGSEASVDHLRNVKLSFVWLMVLVCIFYILNHVCRRHRCDSGSCANEDGQKSQWYQRETSLNVPASNFIFHFNFLQWDKPRITQPSVASGPSLELCFQMFSNHCTVFAIWTIAQSFNFSCQTLGDRLCTLDAFHISNLIRYSEQVCEVCVCYWGGPYLRV